MTGARAVVGALFVALVGAACSSEHAARPQRRLHVYVAASVREVMTSLARDYTTATGVEFSINSGSSSRLASQILLGGQADVFVAADEYEMDRLSEKGLLEPGTRRSLLANRLVVIAPTGVGGVSGPESLLAEAIVRIAIGNPQSVPAGRYARRWLEHEGMLSKVENKLIPLADVSAVLAAVESSAVDLGIVYRTDARSSTQVVVVHEIPTAETPLISYPVAALSGRPETPEAARFVMFLSTAASRARFVAAGFILPQETAGR